MKILRVVDWFGGGLQNDLDLLDYQLLNNFDVEKVGLLYVPTHFESKREITLGGKRELFPLNVGNSKLDFMKYFNPKIVGENFKQINEALEEYDLVHIHAPDYCSSAFVSLMANFKDKPLAVSYHFDRLNSDLVWNKARLLSRVSERVSSWNHAISKAAQSIYFGDSEVVNVPVSDYFSQDRTEKNGFNNLVCVARICPEKGQLDLVNALGNIKDVDFNCKLVGNYQEEDYVRLVKNRIRSLGLEGRVEFLGEISEKEMKEVYSMSSINILPTYAEGLGKVIVEAGLGEIPTISYAVGGVPEVVNHGVNGLLSSRGDVVGLERNIRCLLLNEESQLKFGINAKNEYSERFNPVRCAEKYHQVYSLILGR